ncbi:MAG: N-acetyl-gamma-glutamyl-phosphate reductase [Acidobacteria bacterium]|jgi:N-acetyl-gamma-glutamyl-phosphate reductase|nr:MAG: N-acetyl-gamma-glutamyl-phosphate reductase [Acidobacteriota bacterium]
MEQEVRVCVFGATGYTGAELLRVLVNHPHVRIASLLSKSHFGKKLKEILPSFYGFPLGDIKLSWEPEEDFDLAFLCLPHETSLELVPELIKLGKRVIDLSGAYRIGKPDVYLEFYGFEHKHSDLLEEAVYGLPEIFREHIKGARLVANPGCYPTATLLALYPLLKERMEIESPIVDALSGVSGAGRKTTQKFHYPEMEGNAFAYSVEKHRHVPEIEHIVQKVYGKEVKVRFTPQVIPLARGMMVKLYVKCKEHDFKELYRETYKDEPFVVLLDEPPSIKQVLGSNLCLLYPYYDKERSLLQVIGVIDNLGKGASTQAVQNFNLMMGFDEGLSIRMLPIFP